MGWFSNLFGRRSKSPPTPATGTPDRVDLIPGRLVGRIVSHDVTAGSSRFPCWTYFTEGMTAVGQDELLFTLRRRPGESTPPPDPLMLMAQVFTLAERGQPVGPWEFTVFSSPRGFLGITQQVGVAYVRPTVEIPEVPLTQSPSALLMTSLLPNEAAVVQAIGAYRILSLLGRANRFYPYPHWSDRDRPAVINLADAEASLTAKIGARLFWPDASVRMRMGEVSGPDDIGDRSGSIPGTPVQLIVRRDTGGRLAEQLRQLGDSGTCVLTTSPDPDADVRLVWRPGQDAPEMITPDGSRATLSTGGFLMIGAGPTLQDGGRMIEDGFAVMFHTKTWRALLEALERGTPLDVPARSDGMQAFSLRFR